VRVQETGRSDAAAVTVAEGVLRNVNIVPGAQSVPFTVRGIPQNPRGRYSVRVHVDVDGSGVVRRGDYVSTQSHPFQTSSEPAVVKIAVRPSGSVAGDSREPVRHRVIAITMELGNDTHTSGSWSWISANPTFPRSRSFVPPTSGSGPRFHFDRDRRHFIAARCASTTARSIRRPRAGAHRVLPRPTRQIRAGRRKRPAVQHRSIARGRALRAHLGAPIVVDVEAIQSIEHDKLAARFFSAAECAAFARVPVERRQEAFYTYWARKEAHIKALGCGSSVSLDRFDVAAPREPPRLLADRGDPMSDDGHCMTSMPAGVPCRSPGEKTRDANSGTRKDRQTAF
jgi:hypothetical protein